MTIMPDRIAIDARGLNDLKRQSASDPSGSLRAAATQFDAMLLNMLLKNMRDSLPKDGMLSSTQGDMYTSMLDQQLSQTLAKQGTGLTDVIVRQLSKSKDLQTKSTELGAGPAVASSSTLLDQSQLKGKLQKAYALPKVSGSTSVPVSNIPATTQNISAVDQKKGFVQRMTNEAKAAELQSGIPAKYMVGQAALESGWGKREIKNSDGSPAYNVFGIKAGSNWSGPTADVTTTEFVNGIATKVVAKFRAYASYAESFADYAKLIANSPRYQGAMKAISSGVDSFSKALQGSGYATDPGYAEKLAKVIHQTYKIDSQA